MIFNFESTRHTFCTPSFSTPCVTVPLFPLMHFQSRLGKQCQQMNLSENAVCSLDRSQAGKLAATARPRDRCVYVGGPPCDRPTRYRKIIHRPSSDILPFRPSRAVSFPSVGVFGGRGADGDICGS